MSRSFARRLSRVRWLAVPIAAYLVITLGLPLANGAATRGGFLRHAGVVLGTCGAVVGVVIAAVAVWELASAGARRLVNSRDPSRVGGGT